MDVLMGFVYCENKKEYLQFCFLRQFQNKENMGIYLTGMLLFVNILFQNDNSINAFSIELTKFLGTFLPNCE
jgi:hypothetical protein